MELWVDIATRFGMPTAILAIVLIYHARVVKEKDAALALVNELKDKELARVNELRVNESQAVSDKMIERDMKSLTTWHEVDKTLGLLIERIK